MTFSVQKTRRPAASHTHHKSCNDYDHTSFSSSVGRIPNRCVSLLLLRIRLNRRFLFRWSYPATTMSHESCNNYDHTCLYSLAGRIPLSYRTMNLVMTTTAQASSPWLVVADRKSKYLCHKLCIFFSPGANRSKCLLFTQGKTTNYGIQEVKKKEKRGPVAPYAYQVPGI